ncbi:MAG: hypothetical protein RMM98_14740 [Acidobacteriota bacterium]|nr:hypothetical protein [Blastocatellia bacterium]MDW8240864.1 hypothetical protein [Acidobacteriota bacterium]
MSVKLPIDYHPPARPVGMLSMTEARAALMPHRHTAVHDLAVQRLLAIVAALIAILSVYTMRIADPDLWGHLRYGRLFWEKGSVRVADPFAFTSAGLTWHTHEYLSQILLWLSYAQAGVVGLILLKCVVGGVTVYVLYRTIRLGSDDAPLWAPILMLTASLVSRFFLFRPQIFTFLFFAIFLLILLRHTFSQKTHLWVLPPLLALWANLHGGFIAGIGAVGLVLALCLLQSYHYHRWNLRAIWRDTRPLAVLLAACVAASLLTPSGWRIWPYLLTELTNPYNRRFIREWQPIDLTAPGWSGACFMLLAALLIAAWGLAQRRVATIAGLRPWHWLLSCLPLSVMAFASERHIPLATLWIAPVLALLAQAAWNARPARSAMNVGLLLATCVMSMPAIFGAIITVADPWPRIRLTVDSLGAEHPMGAVAFMRVNRLQGRVYTPPWWGSYLTWELYPDVLVSSDNRHVTLFPLELVGEHQRFYNLEQADVEAPLSRASDFLLMPASTPILPRVRADRRWTAIYDDGQAILFVRADEDHAHILRRHRTGQLQQPQEPPPVWFQ